MTEIRHMLKPLLTWVVKEREYANRCYDRACNMGRDTYILFFGGKKEAFAMVENMIEAKLKEAEAEKAEGESKI